MSDWLSYSLSDFLLFGPPAYWQLFAQGNQMFPPLPFALIGVMGLLVLTQRDRPRLLLIALAVFWGWLAYDFFAIRYVSINWAASYLVPIIAFQGILLLGFGAFGRAMRPSAGSVALLVYAVFVHPLLPLVFGRALTQAEIVGLAPDPTAIATLGVATSFRWGGVLAIIPVVGLAISATTLLTMEQSEGWVLLVVLVLCGCIWLPRIRRSECASPLLKG